MHAAARIRHHGQQHVVVFGNRRFRLIALALALSFAGLFLYVPAGDRHCQRDPPRRACRDRALVGTSARTLCLWHVARHTGPYAGRDGPIPQMRGLAASCQAFAMVLPAGLVTHLAPTFGGRALALGLVQGVLCIAAFASWLVTSPSARSGCPIRIECCTMPGRSNR
jgi:hypothetical protein